jgi:hypothetical protein
METKVKKDLLVRMWHAIDERERTLNLINEIKQQKSKAPDVEPTFRNAFGERCGFQMGVPSGPDSHRIYGVSPTMAEAVLNQHVIDIEKRIEDIEAEIAMAYQDHNADTKRYIENVKKQYDSLFKFAEQFISEMYYVDEDCTKRDAFKVKFREFVRFPFQEEEK